MSAFTLSTSTIAAIVSSLAYNHTSHDEPFPRYIAKLFGDYSLPYNTPMDDEDENEFKKLAADLHQMNVDAVNVRYSHHEKEITEPIENALSPFNCFKTPTILYKQIACLLYQCSEGDIDERPLYKSLEAVKNWLANQIVCDTTEFDKAPWG